MSGWKRSMEKSPDPADATTAGRLQYTDHCRYAGRTYSPGVLIQVVGHSRRGGPTQKIVG